MMSLTPFPRSWITVLFCLEVLQVTPCHLVRSIQGKLTSAGPWGGCRSGVGQTLTTGSAGYKALPFHLRFLVWGNTWQLPSQNLKSALDPNTLGP